MTKFKRRVMVFLAVCMILTMVSACSGTEKNQNAPTSGSASAGGADTGGTPAERPLYVIKYLTPAAGTTKSAFTDETEIGKLVKDKFNIVFEIIPYASNWDEKVTLMLAGGDYPEVLWIQQNPNLFKYIQAGAALPLDDYLKDMPNFTKRYAEQIPVWRSFSEDNKLRNWQSSMSDYMTNLRGLDIGTRIDILKQQNYPELLSEDSWIAYLKQAMIDNPTTPNGEKTVGMAVPFGEQWGMVGVSPIMYEKGDKYSAIAGNGPVIFKHTENKFEDYFKNEYVLESFKFFNKLYREGILDKECFTDKYDQYIEKLNSGRALSAWYAIWGLQTPNQALINAGHPEMQYIVLPVQSNTQVQRKEKRFIQELSQSPFNNMIITKNAKDPKRITELLDWASSDEGQILMQAGFKDRHYTVDSSGKRIPTDLYEKEIHDPDSKVGFGVFSFMTWDSRLDSSGQAYSPAAEKTYDDKINQTPETMDAFHKLGWETSFDYWLKNGIPAKSGVINTIKLDSDSAINQTSEKLIDFRVKNTAPLIMAKDDAEFNAIWDNLMKEYEKMHPETVTDEYNRLYAEVLAKIPQ